MGKIEIPTRVFIGIVATLLSLVAVHIYDASGYKYVSAATLAKKAAPSVVIIECTDVKSGQPQTSTTAGYVFSPYGHIATVAHGVTECLNKKERNIVIRFWQDPDRSHRAKVLRYDPARDAAILQVPTIPSDVRPLDFDISVQMPGTIAVAIGHPHLFYWSIAAGEVSADRLWVSPARHLIQVSTPINPGNSGGPLINSKGKVIGIASFNINGNPTMGFLVPADVILSTAEGLYF